MNHSICIVTQSESFAVSAGMRVRYERFIEAAKLYGITIFAQPIQKILDGRPDFSSDVYIFCKTFTPDALILAYAIRRSGKVVGQDLFDDYFSQDGDARLFSYRDWLRQMAKVTDFAMCTTPRMKQVLQPFLPQCPIVLVEDPVLGYDPFRISALATQKIARAQSSQTLKLAWFGIGDNPYFPVGLDDLTAPGVQAEMARLSLCWKTSLTIATNLRALDSNGLARLRRLPVPVEILEWSEEVERRILSDADVALLPVSSQGFSRAKSMNRALTALEQGCQVVSFGEPLYASLDRFIYRDVDELSTDLRCTTPRLRAETIEDLTRTLDRVANAFDAAQRFITTAGTSPQRSLGKQAPLALIHGRESGIVCHKLVAQFGGLSIRSPYSRAKWNFPVRFDIEMGRIVLRTTPAVANRHQLIIRNDFPAVQIFDLDFVTIDTEALGVGLGSLIGGPSESPFHDLASYSRVMSSIRKACELLFPSCITMISDTSQYRTISECVAA